MDGKNELQALSNVLRNVPLSPDILLHALPCGFFSRLLYVVARKNGATKTLPKEAVTVSGSFRLRAGARWDLPASGRRTDELKAGFCVQQWKKVRELDRALLTYSDSRAPVSPLLVKALFFPL